MSTGDLRRLLVLRGVDVSQFLERSELVAEACRLDATDYDEEARSLFARLNLAPTSPKRYSNLDAIWRPSTQQGCGTVYVGNYVAASDRRTLEERNIVAVVNCQDENSPNYFGNSEEPGKTKIIYHRFNVARLAVAGKIDRATGSGALDVFRATFDFIDSQVKQGHSVLVHCLAGAHRAGTVGVAFLMYKTSMSVDEALAIAQECRPVIGPFGSLLGLLHHLERDLKRHKLLDSGLVKGE